MENIILTTTILKPLQDVWTYYTEPEHIKKWNFANDNWVCPKAENELYKGGSYNYRMEAKDGSFGFDFSGVFEEIIPHEKMVLKLDDGRKIEVHFKKIDESTTEIFQNIEPELHNPYEMQKEGWDKILHNFEIYAENKKN